MLLLTYSSIITNIYIYIVLPTNIKVMCVCLCVCVSVCEFTSAFAFSDSLSLPGWPVFPSLCLALGPSAPDPDDNNNSKSNNITTSHQIKFFGSYIIFLPYVKQHGYAADTDLYSEPELVELLFDLRVELLESRLRSRTIPDVLRSEKVKVMHCLFYLVQVFFNNYTTLTKNIPLLCPLISISKIQL